MKCPNDQTDMEKGSLNLQGARWQEKVIEKGFVDIKGEVVLAFKCPKCGKIELYLENLINK